MRCVSEYYSPYISFLLLLLTQYYAQGDLEDDGLASINLNEIHQLMADCELNVPPLSTRQMLDSEEVEERKGELKKKCDAMYIAITHRRQDSTQVTVEQLAMPSASSRPQPSGPRTKRPGSRGAAEVKPSKIQAPKAEDYDLDLAGFVEILIRLANERYKKKHMLSARFKKLLEHDLVRSKTLYIRSSPFDGNRRSGSVIKLMRQRRAVIRKVFLCYCNHHHVSGKQKEQWTTSMTVDELIAFLLHRCDLGEASSSTVVFGGKQKHTKTLDAMPVSEHDIKSVYASVKVQGMLENQNNSSLMKKKKKHKNREGGSRPQTAEGGILDRLDQVIAYNEFLDVITSLCLYRYPDPYSGLELRITAFIENELQTAEIAKKVRNFSLQ